MLSGLGLPKGMLPKKLLKTGFLAVLWLGCGFGVSAEIRMQDASGFQVVLDKPAQRVISLAPHLTEQVYSAGGGDKLIAAVDHSNYPEEALKLPRVGNYTKVNYELITALKPDLVLAFGGNGHEMINRLRHLGLTVYVDEPRELEQVAELLEKLGAMLGTPGPAQAAAAVFRQRYSTLRARYRNQEKIPVFYQVWDEPLLTINDQHLISAVIRLCGGQNIFSDAIPMAPKVSVESVIRRNPAVIIASGHGEARPDWLDEWGKWPAITAVNQGHLYYIPPDLIQRHTLRILDAAEMMCRYLAQARAGRRD